MIKQKEAGLGPFFLKKLSDSNTRAPPMSLHMECIKCKFGSYCQKANLKANSHELHLMHVADEDGCVSTEIGNFLFFYIAHFCRTRQTQLVLISL